MCGIFALLNNNDNNDVIEKQFYKGQKRGPEYSTIRYNFLNMVLGFHRLSINGLNSKSHQPIIINDVVLICNGEIYNYKNLYKTMNIMPETDSDCEVIIHLFLKYGIEQTLTMLDGVYAFVLFDNRTNHDLVNRVYVARDPYGVRPLYHLYSTTHSLSFEEPHINYIHGFASELKCLEYFYNKNKYEHNVIQFEPGTYMILEHGNQVFSKWIPNVKNRVYHIPKFSYTHLCESEFIKMDEKESYNKYSWEDSLSSLISEYLNLSVVKRCNTTDRPVACLLSGGLDSSLIASLVANYFSKLDKRIETFSIGLEGSEDIKYARQVADYIGSIHTEIIVTEKEMFEAIPEVIKAIESYDTTTVRASIGNYLLGKYIAKHSEAKVIFNGDGSDELFGGYLYMHKCKDDIEFDKETRRLLKDIHLFDVLRSDKSISSNGLEPRTPFLDRTFVDCILSIPPFIRNHNNFSKPEKYLLRQSFNVSYFTDNQSRQILPDSILWRKKEAFSDGVSNEGRSLYTILQEFIAEHYNSMNTDNQHTTCFVPSIELEKRYYKEIFDKEYPNCEHILPYFWMPKYTNASDPSARTLDVYKEV